MDKIRCAIIGTGTMGRRYAVMLDSGLIDDLCLTAVCCHSEASRAWALENLHSSVLICGSEDDLYTNRDAFDAVLVVTPHRLHPVMTIRALQQGKHVMCDKPAGITAADAAAMQAQAQSSGLVYAQMCHQRTYARHKKVKELLLSGRIGQVTRASLINTESFRTRFYHRSGSWRSSWTGEGGGLLINQGHHLLDFWLWLFGAPDTVYADIPFGKYNDFCVDDEATLMMDYPGRMTGTFILSTGEGSSTERLEIVGTRGRILLDGDTLTLTAFDCDSRDYASTAQVTSRQELRETVQQFVFSKDEHAYEIMLQNFAAAIRGQAPLIAPGADGVRTLELINAAYLSAWEERKVSLPISDEVYLRQLHTHEESERVMKRHE